MIGAMEIGNWRATPELNQIYREIRELDLERNLAELEAFGFTMIEGALDPELTTGLRDRIVEITSERIGRPLDVEAETGYQGLQFIPFLLYKDRRFRDVLLNPRPLALVTYLLGRSCAISSVGSHVKGPGGGAGLPLHSDQANGIPQPFPVQSQVANCNYALTDYTEAAGALAMVPGSHHHLRQPMTVEAPVAGPGRNPNAIPVEVPAGSAIVWHGATWHGSFPRQEPGLRVNLSYYFCRPHLLPQEDYRRTVPDGYLGEGDERLATLLGCEQAWGWTDEGLTRRPARQHSWHA
jgi:hypothetical protein